MIKRSPDHCWGRAFFSTRFQGGRPASRRSPRQPAAPWPPLRLSSVASSSSPPPRRLFVSAFMSFSSTPPPRRLHLHLHRRQLRSQCSGRGRQVAVVRLQWSARSGQLAMVSSQWSACSHRLTVLSTVSSHSSARLHGLAVVGSQSSACTGCITVLGLQLSARDVGLCRNDYAPALPVHLCRMLVSA